MKKSGYTKHGQQRANQRGFRSADINLIRRCGSLVGDREAETYLLTNKNVEEEIKKRKEEIQGLERLRGCKAVFLDDQLVTVHHTTRACEKATFRRMY